MWRRTSKVLERASAYDVIRRTLEQFDDPALGQRCGPATRAMLRRQYAVFGDGRFERLVGLSNGNLYNLRQYARHAALSRHAPPFLAGDSFVISVRPSNSRYLRGSRGIRGSKGQGGSVFVNIRMGIQHNGHDFSSDA